MCSETVAKGQSFLKIGFDHLWDIKEECDDLSGLLEDVNSIADRSNLPKVEKLRARLGAIEPFVTMIGQIKSGKTTLVNAMIQQPDLLPSDVNPWTSVVTSVHLNTPRADNAPKATFKLFEKGEWDRLVTNGGRMGELSARAGADDELQRVHEQIQAMQAKSQERLGRKFELLLGQQHDFDEFDSDLIKRYVCLGDDFAEEDDGQGQFADLTKSADLHLDCDAFPTPFCIRDTPGVNDTFMMREQITIGAIRDSQLCVLVLSASQALAATDLGLIRLISNVKSRDLVIFVNRIDELSDAKAQLPEIKESILQTLKKHHGPDNVEIIFGSAYWATAAINGTVEELPEESAEILKQSAAFATETGLTDDNINELTWQLSGVPLLYDVIFERVKAGMARSAINEIRSKARNIVSSFETNENIISLRLEGNSITVMDPESIDMMMDELQQDLSAQLDGQLSEIFGAYSTRLDQSSTRFVDRALEALLQHLESYGEQAIWNYSPDGLRILLRSSHQLMGTRFKKACEATFQDAAERVTRAYKKALSVDAEHFEIEAPVAPKVPPPAIIGQTIALDLQTNWWKGWWKRRKGYRAYSDSFYQLITAEVEPILTDLKETQTGEVRDLALGKLNEFLEEQRSLLKGISSQSRISMQDLNQVFGITDQEIRLELIEMLNEELKSDDDIEAEGEAA